MAQPHRRGLRREYRGFPEAESEFGRMMLREVITPAQYQAGMLFVGLTVAQCAVYDVPSPHPHSIDLTRVGVSLGREMPSEVAVSIKRRYAEMFEACVTAGNRAQRVVKDCAVLDRKVGDFTSLALLRRGLDALVKHFHIDPKLGIDSLKRITETRN